MNRLRCFRLALLTCSLVIATHAFGQKIRLGVITGASLTDDFHSTTHFTPSFLATSTGEPISATGLVNDASQMFIIGPMIEVTLSDHFGLKGEAAHREIRRREKTFLSPPLEFRGETIGSFSPQTTSDFSWEFSLLGKYRVRSRGTAPFVEFGPSILPVENSDKTGLTVGAGVELHVRNLNVAPEVRYTRWVRNIGWEAVPNRVQLVVSIKEDSGVSRRPRLFGHELHAGVIAGLGLTDGLQTEFIDSFTEYSDSGAIGGIMIAAPLTRTLSLEFDGLYRPFHVTGVTLLPDGSRAGPGVRTAFLNWEFPVLAKYSMLPRTVTPFVEAGPSFRIVAHTNSESRSHHGVTAGLGVEVPLQKLRLAPQLRYTRWAADKDRFGRSPSNATRPNQIEFVIGFSF